MKLLWTIIGVTLAIMVGIAVWAQSVVSKVDARKAELDTAYDTQRARVFATDAAFPPNAPPGPLSRERVEPWLRVRGPVAAYLRRRFEEGGEERNYFHARETRNGALERLADGLERERMSFRAFLRTTERWHALLATGKLPALLRDLRAQVTETITVDQMTGFLKELREEEDVRTAVK